jgi:putative transcriptional regulator
MPSMLDPNFSRTVTILCQHDDNGALGIVVNRVVEDMTLADVLGQLEIDAGTAFRAVPVHTGGPVQSQLGLVLHEPLGSWESTLAVAEDLGLTTSRDILAAIADGRGPRRYLLALGYAGWGPGQLESEMAQNAWLSVAADRSILFDAAIDQRWTLAARRLGIDIATLSGDAGHA